MTFTSKRKAEAYLDQTMKRLPGDFGNCTYWIDSAGKTWMVGWDKSRYRILAVDDGRI